MRSIVYLALATLLVQYITGVQSEPRKGSRKVKPEASEEGESGNKTKHGLTSSGNKTKLGWTSNGNKTKRGGSKTKRGWMSSSEDLRRASLGSQNRAAYMTPTEADLSCSLLDQLMVLAEAVKKIPSKDCKPRQPLTEGGKLALKVCAELNSKVSRSSFKEVTLKKAICDPSNTYCLFDTDGAPTGYLSRVCLYLSLTAALVTQFLLFTS